MHLRAGQNLEYHGKGHDQSRLGDERNPVQLHAGTGLRSLVIRNLNLDRPNKNHDFKMTNYKKGIACNFVGKREPRQPPT